MAASVHRHLQHQLSLEHQQQLHQPKPDPDSVSLFQTVDWSCCCCSRRTGILVLGVCFLALSVAVLFLCVAEASSLRASLQPSPNATSPTPSPKATPPPPKPPKMQPHPAAPLPAAAAKRASMLRITKGVLGLVTAQAVVAAAGALSALLLLWGAWARRPKALLPWMVCAAAQVALLVVAALYCICVSMSRKLPVLELDGFFALVIMFLFCVPVLYCLLAVGTFYRELTGAKYSACTTAASADTQPNGIAPALAAAPAPPLARPPAVPAVPPPKRPAPRPPLQRLNSEGHENPAFQSTAF